MLKTLIWIQIQALRAIKIGARHTPCKFLYWVTKQ